MKFTFEIGSKIKEAWPVFKDNFWPLFFLTIIMIALQVVGGKDNFLVTILVYLVGVVLSYIWIRSLLNLVDGKNFNPFSKESLPSLGQYWNFFKTSILSGFFILLGFVLFIIPGFYVAGRLMFALYISVEKNQGARKTLREAWDDTKGYGWVLFWKSFVIGLFIILGFIALFVGFFITYPIGMMLLVVLYREFYKMKNQMSISKSTNLESVIEETKEVEKTNDVEKNKEV